MEGRYRLRIKIGQHEFEAEGDARIVHQQFEVFKELIFSIGTNSQAQQENPPLTPETPDIDAALAKIMKVENRVVSLTVRANTAEGAVLLLLYGQKVLRKNDLVTGAEIMGGLKATGDMNISRIDRLLRQLADEGDVIVIGKRRGKRYRLTNSGINNARQLAVESMAIVV